MKCKTQTVNKNVNPLLQRENFVGNNGKVYLVRCPVCKLENYSPDVATGICVWCEYDANKALEAVIADRKEN